jgi:hypothetical protein
LQLKTPINPLLAIGFYRQDGQDDPRLPVSPACIAAEQLLLPRLSQMSLPRSGGLTGRMQTA